MTIALTAEIDSVTFEQYPSSLGIGIASPRISWKFAAGVRDWYQTEYEIGIRELDNGTSQTYSVASENSVLVPWPAPPLKSRQRVQLSIRARSSNGVWTKPLTTEVEAGLLHETDWSSSFVSSSFTQPLGIAKRPYRLRQSFPVQLSKSHTARLYITALGVYESYLNGIRIGPDVLSPGWTSYSARLPYQTYDVTALLREGANVLSAWVGEGWYSGLLGYQGGSRNIFGHRTGLLAQLEVDGEPVEGDWEWSFGAITSAGIYEGETYDTNLPDASEPLQGEWHMADTLPTPTSKLFSSQSPPIRIIETVKPIKFITSPSGKIILDFGQNLAGVVRLVSNPPSNSESQLIIRHAEVLEHGELGTRPLRFATATDRIALGGKNISGYHPRFTFHGFRYAEVTGWPTICLEDIEAVVFQSSMDPSGTFTCSHALLNRLHENAVWSTRANTIGIPSDCPQRDERLGWTGDVCVYSPTMLYLYNASGFLSEWLQDLWHDQRKLNGVVPIFVPDTGTDVSTPEAIWGDAAVLVPHNVYLSSGDLAVLERQFDSIKMWLDEGIKRNPSTGLWSRDCDQLGDWLAPKAPPETPNMGPTDNLLVADAWLIYSTRTASKISHAIGRIEDATRYETQAKELTEEFYNEYVTRSGRLVSETQTALCLLLRYEIFPPQCKGSLDYRSLFAERLVHLVTKANWLIDTGFAGTPIVLPTLAENGHLSHAYRMIQATECPSWLSPVLLGATTIWERWDSMLADGSINPGEMTSFNHYALGSVASFMHGYIGGLSLLSPGWKTFSIHPRPGGTITSAKTSHQSPYGKIAIEWEIREGIFQMTVEVPPNCTATVTVPGSQQREVIGSGVRHYSSQYSLPSFPPPPYIPHFAPVRPNDWAA
ncbi:hypothetical protein L486_08498 [Kwoniella mangroviensis CBS 10435]|uniref:alpha-L-rhamnosidase n=1 Tax=Kwoniella mangroviensis CBS 10435 TaxID=1331196 RepID=A0A1B9IFD0_9TREE|nr:uncharacterized protein I203_08289 [Kwoniella mangroviensis CBS 8507]OCF54020.1 hypothetical protein L486_08498 [Kwoniella mangroviensis CBS 10435]OCF62657.1 hypothetical protein I203_08289 [Kwoniella mangroviensis CBS 8507]OCF70993.1 hypothetical protein I204_08229 [Kwoniella mangroviensis CBS 8886]